VIITSLVEFDAKKIIFFYEQTNPEKRAEIHQNWNLIRI